MNERPSSGFSLIETLVAVAIAGIAFFVLTETFFNVLLTLEALESEADYQKDIRFVRSQVIQIADRDELLDGGEIQTLDLGEATWDADLAPTDVLDLFALDLYIRFENPEGDPFEHEERLYLLRPTWAEDGFDRSELRADIQRELEAKDRDRDW
jgi:prepilin-type N-terminal cleavage/methylation domain-containing protein